jgi:hypothetical protein
LAAPAVRVLPLFLAGGIALGLGWVVGTPLARSITDRSETVVSGDAAFAVSALVLAVVTAVVLAVRPGPQPAWRVGGVLVGSLLASLVGWGVGVLVGAPALQALGVVLVWPLVTAVVTLARTVVILVIHGE